MPDPSKHTLDGEAEIKRIFNLPDNCAVYIGNSMKRVFTPGDFLQMKPVPFNELVPGDIIAFKLAGSKAIVHRIIRRTQDTLTTMGDNNPAPDKHVVTEKDAPQLIIRRYRQNNKNYPVTHGNLGMLSFRCHRLSYWSIRIICAILRRTYHKLCH